MKVQADFPNPAMMEDFKRYGTEMSFTQIDSESETEIKGIEDNYQRKWKPPAKRTGTGASSSSAHKDKTPK